MKKFVVLTCCVLVLSLLQLISCQSSKIGRNCTVIANPDVYYEAAIIKNQRLKSEYCINAECYFIYNFGRSSVVITQESSRFKVVCYKESFDRMLKRLGCADSAIYTHSVREVYKPLDYNPIKELFEYNSRAPLLYNIRDKEYHPLYMDFMLCDSLGNVRLMADIYTMHATQRFYKEKYGMDLPISHELSKLIFDMIMLDDCRKSL